MTNRRESHEWQNVGEPTRNCALRIDPWLEAT